MNEQLPVHLQPINMPPTSMLRTSEIIAWHGPGNGSAVAETIDLAVQGALTICERVEPETPRQLGSYALQYTQEDTSQCDDDQKTLLKLIFNKNPEPGDSTTFTELSQRPDFVPGIERLRKNIRKSITKGSGEERYFGMDPLIYHKCETPAAVLGGLAFLGIWLGSNMAADFEAPFLKIGGYAGGFLLAAAAYFEVFKELVEKLGPQPRIYEAVEEVDKIKATILERADRPLRDSDQAIYAQNSELQKSYQRALALSVMLGCDAPWLAHFSKMSPRPDWFIAAPGAAQPDNYAASLQNCIQQMRTICNAK